MKNEGKTLDDVCKMIVDCEHRTAPTQSEGYPSIRTPNIGRGRLILEDVLRVSEETYQAWTKRATPQANDLILAREAPVGNVAMIPPNLQVCLGQRTVLIRPDISLVEPAYLLYLLLGDEVQAKIQAPTNGSTVKHLNVADIHSLKLPTLPPLPTQRKIAAILSAYDDLIENNTRRIALLEQMAQAIYREWFVEYRFPGHEQTRMVPSALGMVPEGWDVKNFTEVAEVLSGGTPKTSVDKYWNGEIPFFTPKDVGAHYYVLETEKTLTKEGIKACRSKLFPKNTVFITARGTVGKVALSSCDMTMNQSCYALQGHNNISQYYLFLLTKQVATYLKKMTHGAVFDTIIASTFDKLLVSYPTNDIITKFHNVISSYFEKTLTLQRMIIESRQMRDLLLPKLISGEIDVSHREINK